MPCTSSNEQWDQVLKELQLREFLDRKLRIEIFMFKTPLASLACEAMKLVEASGKLEECSPDLRKWWADHLKRDGGLTYDEGTPEHASKEYEQDVVFYEHLIDKY